MEKISKKVKKGIKTKSFCLSMHSRREVTQRVLRNEVVLFSRVSAASQI
jgi:hypothetical protein